MTEPTQPTPGLMSPFVSFARWWRDFWFSPADPVTLGFIRLCTGLVLLYILVCSTPILSSFYAPDGWLDERVSKQIRKGMPWQPPEGDWEYDGVPSWFVRLDANRDGVVSRKEWTRGEQEFRDIDTSKDGQLSLEEAQRYGAYLVIREEMTGHPDANWIRDDWGVYPRYTTDLGQPLFSHFFHLNTPTQRAIAHGLALLVAVLFTAGVGTRVTSILAWAVGLAYVHRVPAALFGMDTMLGIVLLYLMIGPAGAALSVDRLITNWVRRQNGLPPLEPQPSVRANLVIRLIQVHFCIIYLASGTTKLQGPAWWNGTAIWQILTNYEFAPARFELFTWMLRQLTYNRWVWEVAHLAGAWGTVFLEVSFPFLVWDRRWRWLMICGSVCMHTFIALTMGLTAFSMLMICMVFAFVPPETLHAGLKWAGSWLTRLTQRAETREEPIREVASV